MKLHFEPNLDFQLQAIESVCDLFRGQEICRSEFTVVRPRADVQAEMSFAANDLGVGNRLLLQNDELLQNLRQVQLRNGLPPSESLESGDFTVEMETGTGKTYVYLRTIFELNKRYGFTKFVIVVPSVAIKEGVFKSLQMTEEHFRGLYSGTPSRSFLYDSSRLGEVRSFATSPHIQVMVVTVGAINKFGDEGEAQKEETDETRRRERSRNVMYRRNEKINDERPIDLVSQTRPILIVDEPQTVDGGLEGRGKKALEKFKPLCTLRYSATHVDKHQMIYRLDAVDAYERRLVKQIEVASATVENSHNRPFVRFLGAVRKGSSFRAKLELDVQTEDSGVRRCEQLVNPGELLEQTTGRALYENCRVAEISSGRGSESVEIAMPGEDVILRKGESHGDVEPLAIQRQMIQRTIREHLDKEKRLRPQGIKVLSLFFIDSVEKYRAYGPDGSPVKGEYARIFEEEYLKASKRSEYATLFKGVDLSHPPEAVHDGYFSIDRQKRWTDTPEQESNQSHRENSERAYNLIMRDKEKLLGFETPLKFIFSHSALREGWDNPNVFQICALRDIQSELKRRQTIGRGLRLCVNQDGQRVRGFDVNTLTVIATEGYEAFAEKLQKEIADETGIRFGVVERHQFAAIGVPGAEGTLEPLGFDASNKIWEHLEATELIDSKGKVQDALRLALRDGSFKLPEAFAAQREQVADVLLKLTGRLEIKNADERRSVRPNRKVLVSDDFKALWDRIKHKTTYRVEFDNEKLIADCTDAVKKAPSINPTRLQWTKAGLSIGKAGVEAVELVGANVVPLQESDLDLPDLLTELQDRTQLTRRSLHQILSGSKRLADFKKNPQQFIEFVAESINRHKRHAVVDGIKYQRLGDAHFYAQELFETEELTGYLKNMLSDARKSVYEQVVYDSSIESSFADQLEKNVAVKVYAKLPGWFTVPTPLGSYNPDWAVLVDGEEGERLYLVVETKSTLFLEGLRTAEQDKIGCATAHFQTLTVNEAPVKYVVAATVSEMLSRDDLAK